MITRQDGSMTIPQDARATPQLDARGRSFASAITVFLGGYLLLASLSGQLPHVLRSMFASLDRTGPDLPEIAPFLVLQYLFAIAVVVAGLLIGGGPRSWRIAGAVVVVVGSLFTAVFLGLRTAGLVGMTDPGARIPFLALLGNTWFAIVLIVGVGWLLSRRARRGWLSILATLILVPIPMALLLNDVEDAHLQLIMFGLSGLIGAGIIVAGGLLRDIDGADARALDGQPGVERSLAAAVATFLGGYLVLAALNGQLWTVASNAVAGLTDGPVYKISEWAAALLVLQFVFAIAVVISGILLAGGTAVRRLIGTILVVVGSLIPFLLIGLRLNGMISIPQPVATVFNAVFLNEWFVVVLAVGTAWLLNRPAIGSRWLVLLATLALPVVALVRFRDNDAGTTALIMFALSGIVGAAIIFAGRPLRD